MKTAKTVNWKSYAYKYDLLIKYNPFYQRLHQEVMEMACQWDIQPGSRIADVGAGTGNYSLMLAQLFPQAEVLHIDSDEGMNEMAQLKQEAKGLDNHSILQQGIDEVGLPEHSLQALVSVHALYTFPDPTAALRKMYKWLRPGGQAILVNAGRIVNVLDWQLALGWHMVREHGLRKTWNIFQQGKEVSKQNASIRQMQRNGIFWTHTHGEFCDAVEAAGFELLIDRTTFRGKSDLVLVRKAKSTNATIKKAPISGAQ